MTTEEIEECKTQTIENFSARISKWLEENKIPLTHENIRRYFALKHPHDDVKESSITKIYHIINVR